MCVIDIFSKYAWVVPLKDKKGVAITNAFQKILNCSNIRQRQSKGRKPNKIWVDNGSEFYNNSFKKWLKDNDIEIFSKYAWVVPLKDKKCVTITDAFRKILKESNRKPNKIWVDKISEFYNNTFKK